MIDEPVAVLTVLLGVLAGLFGVTSQPWGARFFRVVPLLIFAYFVPTVLSNSGLIPLDSPTYEMIKTWLLPASLLLLTMSIDIPAIVRLGWKVIVLFLAGTVSIVMGGPLAFLAFGWLIPPELQDEAWKGLGALSGSWIGGGANFVAIGESVGVAETTLGMMVVIDVALANVWMAVLLFLAGHDQRLDAAIGADRAALEELRQRIQKFQRETQRAPTVADLCQMLFLAFGSTVLAAQLATGLPTFAEILSPFAWTVILVTTAGVAISFTPIRKLEGAGASKLGSVFLYLLVASIGAQAEFRRVLDMPGLLVIGAVWIGAHAIILLLLRWCLRAPVFYMAVGSQANIGGAASAPIVAGAFHPSLAPVGALLGVAGYVLGTYAGLTCAALMQLVYRLVYA